MKTTRHFKVTRNHIAYFLILLMASGDMNAQSSTTSVGNWTFDNVLNGTGSAHNTVGAASLGSSILSGAYNGGTVYFGEDGWPTGGLDANAYLQFTLTPNSGKLLSITVLSMHIRRSTTGTPSGSGPNNWALRSSLDGYSSNITSGILSTNSTPAINISLPVSFLNLTTTVGFRLYGYNATVSPSGGLNRFVYDNITATGSLILPELIQDFHALRLNNESVRLAWNLNTSENISSSSIEISNNAVDFHLLNIIDPAITGYVDESSHAEFTDKYYRIKIISATGVVYYSMVEHIVFKATEHFAVRSLPTTHGSTLSVSVKTEHSKNIHFSLYNMNGSRESETSAALIDGSQIINIGRAPNQAGLYVLISKDGYQTISTQIWIN